MTKAKATPDFFQALGKALVRGAVEAGNRAAASAVRSVVKDGKQMMKKAARELEKVEIKASDFIGHDHDEEEENLHDVRESTPPVVDAEFEPTTRTKRKKT